MGEGIITLCSSCNGKVNTLFVGRGIDDELSNEKYRNNLPASCTNCRITLSRTAEDPFCPQCQRPVEFLGQFYIIPKTEKSERSTDFDYVIPIEVITNPASNPILGFPHVHLQLADLIPKAKRSLWERLFPASLRKKYVLRFKTDFNKYYTCPVCRQNSLTLKHRAINWD